MTQSIEQLTLARPAVRRTVALVLAGGRGSRLKQLTDRRAKPAVYFGGKFRIIDFALSNCVNSGIRRIGVLTQYKSHSLLRHLQRGWSFLRGELNEFVDLLPAQQRIDEEHWYRGTADAVYQNIDIIQRSTPHDYVVVLAGDHIYKMDYSLMLQDHVEHGARLHRRLHRGAAHGGDGLRRDGTSTTSATITAFLEKPADPPAMPGNPDIALASMGIYVFNAEYLYELLEEDMRQPELEPRFRQGHHSARRGARAARRRTRSACRASRETRTAQRLLARRRHGRCVLGGEHRPGLDRRRSSTSTTPTGRSGPTRSSCRRPSSCPTSDGTHGIDRQHDGVGRLHRLGLDVRNSVLFSNVRVHSFCDDQRGGAAARRRRSVAAAACSKVVIDRGCVIPEGMVIGEDPKPTRARFERTDSGVALVTPECSAHREA